MGTRKRKDKYGIFVFDEDGDRVGEPLATSSSKAVAKKQLDEHLARGTMCGVFELDSNDREKPQQARVDKLTKIQKEFLSLKNDDENTHPDSITDADVIIASVPELRASEPKSKAEKTFAVFRLTTTSWPFVKPHSTFATKEEADESERAMNADKGCARYVVQELRDGLWRLDVARYPDVQGRNEPQNPNVKLSAKERRTTLDTRTPEDRVKGKFVVAQVNIINDGQEEKRVYTIPPTKRRAESENIAAVLNWLNRDNNDISFVVEAR